MLEEPLYSVLSFFKTLNGTLVGLNDETRNYEPNAFQWGNSWDYLCVIANKIQNAMNLMYYNSLVGIENLYLKHFKPLKVFN